MRTVPAAIFAVLGSAEGYAALQRHADRTRLYEQAEARSEATGRPLLVIGDPDAGAHTSLARAYGCGDECVDLNGCPACPVNYSADITKPIQEISSDSRVVFVSCVLEYVNNFDAAWDEIMRIAGSTDNVFVASVQPYSFTAALYPNANWTLHPVPTGDERPAYDAEPVTTTRKVVSLGVIAGLVAWMFWPR
jgi:hypothetical protein